MITQLSLERLFQTSQQNFERISELSKVVYHLPNNLDFFSKPKPLEKDLNIKTLGILKSQDLYVSAQLSQIRFSQYSYQDIKHKIHLENKAFTLIIDDIKLDPYCCSWADLHTGSELTNHGELDHQTKRQIYHCLEENGLLYVAVQDEIVYKNNQKRIDYGVEAMDLETGFGISTFDKKATEGYRFLKDDPNKFYAALYTNQRDNVLSLPLSVLLLLNHTEVLCTEIEDIDKPLTRQQKRNNHYQSRQHMLFSFRMSPRLLLNESINGKYQKIITTLNKNVCYSGEGGELERDFMLSPIDFGVAESEYENYLDKMKRAEASFI